MDGGDHLVLAGTAVGSDDVAEEPDRVLFIGTGGGTLGFLKGVREVHRRGYGGADAETERDAEIGPDHFRGMGQRLLDLLHGGSNGLDLSEIEDHREVLRIVGDEIAAGIALDNLPRHGEAGGVECEPAVTLRIAACGGIGGEYGIGGNVAVEIQRELHLGGLCLQDLLGGDGIGEKAGEELLLKGLERGLGGAGGGTGLRLLIGSDPPDGLLKRSTERIGIELDFHQVIHRLKGDGLPNQIEFLIGSQHDEGRDRPVLLFGLLEHIQPGFNGHLNVGNDDIGPQLADELQGLFPVPRGSDNFHILKALGEHGPKSDLDKGFIVCNQYPGHTLAPSVFCSWLRSVQQGMVMVTVVYCPTSLRMVMP